LILLIVPMLPCDSVATTSVASSLGIVLILTAAEEDAPAIVGGAEATVFDTVGVRASAGSGLTTGTTGTAKGAAAVIVDETGTVSDLTTGSAKGAATVVIDETGAVSDLTAGTAKGAAAVVAYE
jgi:hypothetical protein